MTELYSWNVNGIRACLKNGFREWFNSVQPDILCLQEVKADQDTFNDLFNQLSGYYSYCNCPQKGYAGTAVFSKIEPEKVMMGMNKTKGDPEGRIISLFFKNFILVNVYFPNAQRELKRLDYKLDFNKKILTYFNKLTKINPHLIVCGDFNVAHQEIDLKNWKSNRRNAGFTDEERDSFSRFIEKGYVDSFRYFNQEPDHYTWWSYRFKARERNIGWRIDYFLISPKIVSKLKSAHILSEVYGSDHCPVMIEVDL
ncbi:MAG: exodeoxyribonuclease III [Desulfuromonas sp. SDB]|nr:MAG: exodeoxyribonuclease III [Desulfuromonas sp. SDB]